MELFKIMGKIAIDNTESNKKLEETSGKASNASGKMSAAFKKIGAAVAASLSVAAVVNFGKGCIQAAADANAMSSQFSQVFGNLESQAGASLTKIADEAGITENRMKGSFTKIAAFAKTTGMDTEGALALSERAMIAVADSAAFYDRSLEETTESLQSFLKGNYENDAALGLSCTEITRNEAANKLYGKSFKDLSESQKQLTLLQMVEDANKASGALGQAARESDTWTNVTGNLQQAWKDFQAALGINVLDVAVGVVKKLVGAVEKCTEKVPEAVKWFGELKSKAEELSQGPLAWLKDKIEAARDGFEKVADFAKRLWDNLEPLVTLIRDNLVEAFHGLSEPMGKIKENFQKLQPLFEGVAAVLGGALAAAIGIAIGAFNGIASAVEGFMTMISGVVGIVANVFELIVGIFTGDGEKIKEAVTGIGDGIVDVFGGLWDAVSGFVEGFVDGVVGFFEGLWDTLVGHSIVPDTIDGVASCFGELWGKVSGSVSDFCSNVTSKFTELKDKATEKFGELKDKAVEKFGQLKESAGEKWESLKSTVSEKASTLKEKATTAFSNLKDKAVSLASSTKDKASGAWETLKEKTSTLFNSAKDSAATAFTSLKSNVATESSAANTEASNKFNSMKSSISLAVSNAKSLAVSAFESIKSNISTYVSGALDMVTSKFTAIRDKISEMMESAKSIVTSAIERIKSAFDISLKLDIKLPHVSVHGGTAPYGIGGKGTLPSFSVEWYKKAYDKAMILNDPTIFGYSAASGKMLGGGDGNGNEVVAGESHLMNLIGQVVENKAAGQNDRIIEILIAILHAITGGNEELLRALLSGQKIVLNEREFARAVRTYA